jgi:hypothetical protein
MGGISPSENRILTTFGEEEKKDEKEQREIELVPVSKLTTEKKKLLSVLMAEEIELEECIGRSEITKMLASELCRRTGVLAYQKYCVLVMSICGHPSERGQQKMVFRNGKQECHFDLEDELIQHHPTQPANT